MINNPNTPTQGYPNFPATPPNRPRTWIWIAGIVVVVLIIGVFAIFAISGGFAAPASNASAQATVTATTPASTPGATTTASPDGGSPSNSPSNSPGSSTGGSTGGAPISVAQAITTVNVYYADINAKNYQDAYNHWGSNYRSAISYATFAQGFANTQRDGLQIGSATSLSNGTVKVPVTVTATIASGASITVNTYQGYYIAGLEGSQARLLSANLQITNSNHDVVKRAISLVLQYYSDINSKYYADAYSIWGAAYHGSTSYSQFAAGFASTKSVSISINYDGAMVLADGSVQVPLTIYAQNASGSSTVSHTYSGYYIIGMENQVYHLLRASIQ